LRYNKRDEKMKLVAFRVQNYKKIRDTNWITIRELTAFVGKNEAGKSALFRGLSKLNPSDGEKYDGLKEFPRRRYTDEFKNQDWPVASAKFELNESEQNELAKVAPELKEVTHVICTRYYSWKLDVEFEPLPSVSPLTRSDFLAGLENLEESIRNLTASEGKGDALGQMKNSLLQKIDQLKNQQRSRPDADEVPNSEVQQLVDAIATQTNEEWQKETLAPIRQIAEEILERAKSSERVQKAKKWVEDNLPKFIYFDRYDVIDSAVHLPTFVRQLNSNPTAPKVRTTRCLFEHVGLDIRYLANLGQHQPGQEQDERIRRHVDERAIHFSSASSAMTNKFQDWWEQRRHKFRYQADGDYFRIWVSDDLDPSEIELDQRSLGMQYFFSFYTVFLVEAREKHQKAILLLDEPGLHMHGTAQAKVVKFLEKLAQENQTLYSTHSPFMVDADHLERVRIVYEAEDGTTKVSENVWPQDKNALFPLFLAIEACIHDGWLLLRNFRGLDKLFAYYLLLHELAALVEKGSGSVFTNLKTEILKKHKVRVPPLPEQRAIAHILCTLDDKIELNRQMSETLEAMVRALFKSWFVDFEQVLAKCRGESATRPNKPLHSGQFASWLD
jgi:predicted ATPase